MKMRKWASLGLALIMAVTMILSNVGIVNVKAANTVTVNGEEKEVVATVNLTPVHTASTLVQFGNVYDFGVAENGRLGFSGTLKLDGKPLVVEDQFYFSGYKNNTTICLNFGSAHEGKLVTIEKDSVIYYGDKAVVISETFNQKWDGSSWTAQVVDSEPETLTVSGVHWGASNVLMLKSNLPLTLGSVDEAADKNLNEEGSAKPSSKIRTMPNAGENPTNQLLVIDFGTAYEQNENYVLKKDSSVTFGDTEYVLDKDVQVYFDGSGWQEGTAPEKKTETLTVSGVHWGASNVLMLKSNLPLALGSVDETADKNLNEEGSAKPSSKIRTMPNAGENPTNQLLIIDFGTAYEQNENYVLKKDSSVTFGDTEYVLDKDVQVYFDGSGWQEGTAPTPKPEDPQPEHIHKYNKTIVKATTTKAGSITEACACGDVKSKTVIPAASKISLSKTAVSYNKKTQKVTVSVKDSKGKALAASQYSVSGTVSAKKVGTYKVKVTLKGNYMGSTTLTWKINPNATKVSSVKAGKKSLTVTWKKQSTETTGYKIQVSTDKNFKKSVKTVTVSKNKTTSKKITGLKKNKKYYVRICTYKGSNTSAWAKYSKSVKVK